MSRLPSDREILTVSQFSREVKEVLENEIGACWLRGEISNLRRQASGHTYFSLKDNNSQVSAVLFRGNAMHLDIDLQAGMQVIVYGEISVYEPRGNYQIIVRLALEDGQGRLQMAFEQLKNKLTAEGLFDRDRKKTIPLLPRTIGVITSPTGAAIQDFISVLKRRNWTGHLIIYPAKVQGDGAAKDIITMIHAAQKLAQVELLVICRGGGSLEDLWTFNEENVARAIAECVLPTISAIGHEIDFTLADFAADLRAETPTGAAEQVSSAYLDYKNRIKDANLRLRNRQKYTLENLKKTVNLLKIRHRNCSPAAKMEHFALRIDDLHHRLHSNVHTSIANRKHTLMNYISRLAYHSPKSRIIIYNSTFATLQNRLQQTLKNRFEKEYKQIQFLEKRLENANPKNVLNRGFAIVKNSDGKIVSSANAVKPGEKLINEFAESTIETTVTKVLEP